MSVAAGDLRRLHGQLVDARGRRRPGPVLALKKSLGTAPVGAVLELLATDPTSQDELASWSVKSGQEYLGTYLDGDELHVFVRRLT